MGLSPAFAFVERVSVPASPRKKKNGKKEGEREREKKREREREKGGELRMGEKKSREWSQPRLTCWGGRGGVVWASGGGSGGVVVGGGGKKRAGRKPRDLSGRLPRGGRGVKLK